MTKKRRIKIILDTNWWISFLLSSKSSNLPDILLNERFIICYSEELKTEIYNVLSYTRIQQRINPLNLAEAISYLNELATCYTVTSEINACRDPKDNFLLALALDAQADYLITNDQDLLILKQFNHTRIFTLSAFVAEQKRPSPR